MNGYLIPANAKRGTLIFNIFRPVDLFIFGGGIAASLCMLLFLPSGSNILIAVISILPACITGLLVFPVPNYQNVLCILISIYQFYTERRRYIWKGWCFSEQVRYEQEHGKSAKK